MTETALNERIAELQENESEAAHQWQKARRRLRRDTLHQAHHSAVW